ncbi:hypothetical protein CRG98_017788 [Punica granatum]|uniref:Ionotropic glutamate receptor C-terminal domain-containing protein n=1 Tax=Punica granatum TaxID=22663 RepID=A0A2I0JZR7_PUNGR|nr:hypothetical protein CRG98_017788 [Punica granatum]
MGIPTLHISGIVVLIMFCFSGSQSSGEMVRTVNDEKILDIGVILNLGSLVGKEARAAIEISSQDFNSISRGYKLKLHHENSGGKPLLAVSSAEKLIKRKKVKAIIGLETWKVAELVAELGNRFQVPMISLAGNQFGRMIPGVIQMVSNKSEQLRCMANIVRTYNRHRASIIYEDMYDDNYSLSLYLSKELHNAGSEIEEQVVLPPYSSLSDPAYVVKQKLGMFKGKLSPVFIVLDLSLPMSKFDGLSGQVAFIEGQILNPRKPKLTYNVAVGDITILANRSENVDFTQPFMESGLSMIVVAEPDKTDSLIFLKPFTPTMWLASGGVLIFTMLTVWFLERSKSPAFQGKKLTDQLATALWFTFCSLFHAHGDIIYRNLTRIVLVVWFFEALILTQSYTASLTSMLTVQKLKQNQITMEWLKQNNARVGCDNSTFVCDLLERAHNFRKDTIVGINNYTEFHEQLNNGIIKAIFVEYPYERAFLTRYCSGFSVTHQSYRFGGFGFAFEKGSPWTKKFSEAILELSESGKLKQMEDKSFQKECLMEKANATASSDSKTQSLGLGSFWALHVYSLGTSALCLLLSWFRSRRNGDSGHANIADGQPNGASQREHRNLEMDELHDQTR